MSQPRERSWRVDGLEIHGLEWGTPGSPPVLALHGWQDNAASFIPMAQRLVPFFHLVALDLSGHGRSDDRSADATYNIWDDLPQLCGVLDQLGWDRCSLLGHSRGAIIAALLAAAVPARIERLALLDALLPEAVAENAFATQLGAFLRDRRSAADSRARIYQEREDALAARMRRGLSREATALLAERSLRSDGEGGWYWRSDPRLRGASAAKLTPGQGDAVLGALRAPVLLVLASRGLTVTDSRLADVEQQVKHLQLLEVEGEHHFHMQAEEAHWVETLRGFLSED